MAILPIAEGERWAYRQAKGPLQEVTILKVTSQSGNSRVRIQFEDGESEGQAEWVFRRMLKVPWDQGEALLEHERLWESARNWGEPITDNELTAAQIILDETIDAAIAGPYSYGLLAVHDRSALEELVQIPLPGPQSPGAFEENGIQYLPWPAMRDVALVQARALPQVLLEYVERAAVELAESDSRFRQLTALDGFPRPLGLDQSREFDEERRRYLNQIRQWCGEEALGKWDEILYLRGDNARLAGLMNEALMVLEKAGRERDAKRLRRQLGYPFIPWHKRRGEPDPLGRDEESIGDSDRKSGVP